MTKRKVAVLVTAGALALIGAACGDGEEGGGGGGNTVNVELKDMSLTPDVSSVGAGSVSFVADNTGPSEHEVVVLKTDLAPDALSVEGGKVDEGASGIELIGEIEEFAAGAQESVTFDLTAGAYVLICNIPGHYEAGMTAPLEVG